MRITPWTSEQAQLTTDRGRAAPDGFFVAGLASIEQSLQIVVAQACDRPLAAAEGPKQCGVAAQKLEGTIAAYLVSARSAKRTDQLLQPVPIRVLAGASM